jgi:hypothetical protein
MCGAPAEDVPHFLLHCPALAGPRAQLAAALEAACRSEPVLALFAAAHQAPGPDAMDALVLQLALGGDPTATDDAPGAPTAFMQTKGMAARRGGGGELQAADRVATLRVANQRLTRMAGARLSILLSGGLVPQDEGAGWLRHREYRPAAVDMRAAGGPEPASSI